MTLETTSTAGQLAQHDATGVLTPSEAVTAAVHAWVAGLDVAIQGAQFVVDTPACPDSFWPLPPDVKVAKIPGKNPKLQLPDEPRESYLARRMVAVQTVGSVVRYGLGLGLPPEVALQGIFVIGGRYAMYAEQMVALIKSRGHKHRVVERSAAQCVVEVKHRDESDWEQFTFTMEDAITAGYVKGKGPNTGSNDWKGNDKYNTDPKGMLYARVSSIACKTKFPDDLRGMATYEELQDERAADNADVRVITNVTASDISQRTALPQVPQPVAQSEASTVQQEVPQTGPPAAQPAQDAPAAETGEASTLEQRQALGVALRVLDLGGTDDKVAALKVISAIAGRVVTATSDLARSEADTVLAKLEELSKRTKPKWQAEIRQLVADAEAIASSEGQPR